MGTNKFVGESGVEYARVHGDSYPVRESLKQLRGRWNPEAKCWMVPKENAERANYLVNGDDDGRRPAQRGSVGWDGDGEPVQRGVTSLADSFSMRHSAHVPAFLTDESIAQFGTGSLSASPYGTARLRLNEHFLDVAEKHHGLLALVDSYYDDED